MARRPNPYQFFEPLPPEQFEALKRDITQHGQQIAIELDERGVTITGHERQRACKDLGVKPKVVVREGMTEAEKVRHAITDNVLRRQLGPIAKAKALLRLAELEGATLGTRGGPAGDRRTVQRLAELFGADRSTAYRWISAARELEGHPDLVAEVDSERMELRRAITVAREREARSRPSPHPEAMPDAIDIRLGDFRKVLSDVPPGGVDLIFTDPPYDAAGLPVYSDLGTLGARILAPEGVLLAEAGSLYLPEVIDRLSENLSYRWCLAMVLPGRSARVYPAKALNGWRPLLAFRLPGSKPARWFKDTLVISEPSNKTLHAWQKSVQAASYYIEQLSNPGQLVVDPFVGSGTTAVASLRLGRRFIGAEIDRGAWRVARARLADELAKGGQ